jgi:hypothetical protein
MSTQYRILTKKEDPTISLKVPVELYEDLVDKAAQSGRDHSVEMLLRLARTLQHDEELMATDRLMQAIFSDRSVNAARK